MEIDLNFDDEIFEKPKVKASKCKEPYNAKCHNSKWFEKAVAEDVLDQAFIFKCRADFLFYDQQYDKALENFNKCLEVIPSKNVPVLKDVKESIVRCQLYLNLFEDALALALEIFSEIQNVDQETVAFNLLYETYFQYCRYKDALTILHQMINIHPFTAHLWFKLAQLYICLYHSIDENEKLCPLTLNSLSIDELHKMKDSTVLCCSCNIWSCKHCRLKLLMGASLIRARLLFQSVQHTVGSFVKLKNINYQEKISHYLSHLDLPLTFEKKATEFLSKDITKTMDNEEDKIVEVWPYEKCSSFSMEIRKVFETRWFTWIKTLSF